MCGRYTLATPEQELIETFDLPGLTFEYFARYNIAPGQEAPVVAEDRRGRRAGLMTWGLVPAWRRDRAKGIINARSETVAEKPAFRESFERRRCLVPADGFYEWKRESDGRKAPFWLHPTGGGPIAFAGVWDRWGKGERALFSFAILTTASNPDVSAIHDRMPVIVPRRAWTAWLARSSAPEELDSVLRVPGAGLLSARRVSTRVNSAREDDPALLEGVE